MKLLLPTQLEFYTVFVRLRGIKSPNREPGIVRREWKPCPAWGGRSFYFVATVCGPYRLVFCLGVSGRWCRQIKAVMREGGGRRRGSCGKQGGEQTHAQSSGQTAGHAVGLQEGSRGP